MKVFQEGAETGWSMPQRELDQGIMNATICVGQVKPCHCEICALPLLHGGFWLAWSGVQHNQGWQA